jgi:hypothetical protein
MSTPEIRGIIAPKLPVVSCQLPVNASLSCLHWQLTTGNWQLLLSLFLLMFGVRADHPHDAFSPDDLAVFADTPDAATHFHVKSSCKAGPNRRIG